MTFSSIALYMQQILARQEEMEGDNVGYLLARTVRSCVQFNAAKDLGCKGQGNQCLRGPCMAAAMAMFDGKKMEGISKVVVDALIKY